jgi:nucleoside-diphosphate-sugar epimerase
MQIRYNIQIMEQTKILITGASGFIGSFLCEEALRRRMSVWAGMRHGSKRKWLQSEWLKFVTLDMEDPESLEKQISDFKAKYGKWDIVIHAAGATKCLHKEDFERANFLCTRNLVDTLRKLDMTPKQFIYVSSLSVLGPLREEAVAPYDVKLPSEAEEDTDFIKLYTVRKSVYSPMTEADCPMPNTAYGKSKIMSEEYLKSLGNEFPTVIFRPTGVYGPRERDYFLMAKSIKSHIDFAVGYKPQEITFIYVKDLVGAIFAATDRRITGRTYFVSDGYVYTSRAFSDLVQRELGISGVMHIKAPLWVLRCVSALSEFFSRFTGKPSTLNADKYKIMKQRNWQCDITPMIRELGYIPQWNLERGVEETISWYKKEKWL